MAGVGVITLAAAAAVVPSAAAADAQAAPAQSYRPTTVRWHACPRYSDAVLGYLGFPRQVQADFRKLWARTRCGTVQVPLDYSDPGGRKITIAVTLLKALDQAHRRGGLVVNPGGPGTSGYLMPVQLALPGSPSAALNKRYDLIGFDPRGVGYSTRADCPGLSQGRQTAPGPLTEAEARQAYDVQVAANRACAMSDPVLLSQLTTANVARDVNEVRIALHLPKISFFGVSWGTALGAYYRTLFPGTVSRMWLDSVMGPDFRFDQYTNANAAVTEQDYTRLTGWIAAHDGSYGFGATTARVRAALVRLERAYNTHPRKFTGLPTEIDGSVIAETSAQPSPLWPQAAEVLKELRDAKGTTAPPAVKKLLGAMPPPVQAGAPQTRNHTMGQAVTCNEDAGNRDFASSWAAYQQRLGGYPVIGELFLPSGQTRCAGWPFPVQPWQLRRVGGSLELSGHRYDTVTPYQWTQQMRSVIGGDVYTVDDDIHAGAIMVPACAGHVIAYFDTGHPQTGQCPGVPVPASTMPPGSAGALASAVMPDS
jgi:pimeloyl-ACP methyl ester carboxylesterase